MENILQVIKEFEPITLPEMDKVSLLNRTDIKYVFNRKKLTDILLAAKENYRALTVNGMNYTDYDTFYFDTPDYRFYLDHHNRRFNRYKVRTRSYVNSDLHFFEIKFKSNKSRTIKSRIKISQPDEIISGECAEFLKSKTGIAPDTLCQSLHIKYRRITLVNKNFSERITIDFDMNYIVGGTAHEYPELVIVEVKQERVNKSKIRQIMHEQHLHAVSLSKYCFGIANYVEGIKRNNFKTQILYVQKICNQPTD